jgi:hypothetical protein
LPVFFPPEGSLGHAPVQAQPLPVDALQAVIFEQPGLPQGQEDAGLEPLLEAVVGRGPWAELGRVECFPLAAGAQHEEDGIHTHPVRGARSTTAEAVGIHVAGQVHLDLRPQVIGNAPVVGDEVGIHDSTGKRASAAGKQVQLYAAVIALLRLFG